MERANIIFLARFIISSKYRIRLEILKNITQQQCKYLRQIFLNILLNSSLELTDRDRAYFRRLLTTIKILASKRVCKKTKLGIFVKNAALVIRACKITVKYLS